MKDHHRKLKRQAKKNRDPTAKKKKSTGLIPSNVPFKDKILQEAKELKDKEIERKKLLKGVLNGKIKMDAIINEKPIFKLNSKKKPIKLKKSINSKVNDSTGESSKQTNNDESMQCD